MRPKPYSDCPEESTLQEVAAEMASAETSTHVLQHSSQCDHCGPLLSQYLEDFSDEISPEIEALIEQLPFSQPQWQRQKAKEIAAPSIWRRIVRRTVESGFKIPATVGAMAAVLAGVGIRVGPPIINWAQMRAANNLMSAAYTEKRTMEARLTGVEHAPYQPAESSMGSGGQSDYRPALDELRSKISRKLGPGDQDKLDPGWWEIKGRELLLQSSSDPKNAEKYLKEAKANFEEARRRGIKGLKPEIGLAIADFQNDSMLHSKDFKNTIERLKTVLNSTPTLDEKKTALYNLGLAYERTNSLDLAVFTWEDYLKADPTGAWADEVRQHLDEDRKKTPRHPVYPNPSGYNAHSHEREVSRDVEQYQQIAFEQLWLPQAIKDPASEAGKAVYNIAENFKQQHCDPMLADLLAFPGKGDGPPAIRALSVVFIPSQNDGPKEAIDCSRKVAGLFASRAVFKDGPWAIQALRSASNPTQNDVQKETSDCRQGITGTYPSGGLKDRASATEALSAAFANNKNDNQEEAISCSHKAAGLFARSGNVAGELLARYQEIYALQRELDADACLDHLDKTWARAFATRYYWLQGQLALEKAICANMAFKSTTTERSLALSIAIAAEFHFPELSLRILGMKAGIARLNRQFDEAWGDALDGMEQYWKDEYSSERQYQFYAVMRSIAAESGYLHTSEAYLRRSIDILETTAPEDFGLKFALNASLAKLLRQMGEEPAAEAEAKRARESIAAMQGGKTMVPAYLEVPAIEVADFELHRGQPALALSTLKPVGDAPRTADKFVKLDFFQVRGDAKLRMGRFDEAAEDYRRGIHVAQEFFNQSSNNEIKRLSWVRATNRIYAGFVQILLAKGQGEKALKVWEWSKRQLLDRANTQLLDVVTQADALSLRTAYPHIIYASFEDQLQIWVVKDGRVVGRSVPLKQSRLRSRILDFNSNCQNKNSLESEVEKQEAELYELLLQPVLADLASSEKVAIEFDDALPSFAIEALKSPSGSYFGDDYRVLQSPGILAEKVLHEPMPLKPQEKFLVVDALPEAGPEALPGQELPVRAIERTYSNRVLLRGANLTPRDLNQEMRASAAMLVISHGVLRSEGMGLKITEDWSLRAKDFMPENVDRLRLAVLAACSSGYSENGLPDPDNMVRSLLASGVPNVLASRWDVDSQSTGELFEGFYTYLGQGEAADQALQHARRQLRSQRNHPYYWAGFYLTGKLPTTGR